MQQQRGASLIGWLIILIFIGFVALLVIRVAPVYVEAYTVKSILNGLQNDRDLSRSDRSAVLQSLLKRLDVNAVKSVKRGDIKLDSSGAGLEVIIDYETRFPLVGNIDGIAHFRQQATIRR